MARDLIRIAARLFNAPLLVLPETAATIASNLADRFGVVAVQQVKAAFWDDDDDDSPPAQRSYYENVDGIAVIPVKGELVNRGSWVGASSGLTAYEGLAKCLKAAAADPAVRGIVLDIDSPGGEASGAMETADLVRATSREKTVKAFVNSTGASAAYAIAAGASEIIVTPSASVGSIGVVCMHVDRSQQVASAGIKPTFIYAGAYKVDGNAMAPLEPEARARIQSMIDGVYDLFVASVGKHRPKLGEAGARATEAGVHMGAKAVESGLADRVGSLSDVLASFPSNRFGAGRSNGVLKMSTQDQAGIPLAEHATAVARARSEGVEEGRGVGATAERERIKAITGCEEAKGRESSAQHLAFNTAATLEDAKNILFGLAVAQPATPSRMSQVHKPAVRPDAPHAPDAAAAQAKIDADYADIAGKLNAKNSSKKS